MAKFVPTTFPIEGTSGLEIAADVASSDYGARMASRIASPRIIDGDVAGGIAALVGGAIGLFFGQLGIKTANFSVHRITPSMLLRLGRQAWDVIDRSTRNLVRLDFVPSKTSKLLEHALDTGTNAVGNFSPTGSKASTKKT